MQASNVRVVDPELLDGVDASVSDLVGRISEDLTVIGKDVVALARLEVTRDLKATLADAAGIVLGGVVTLIAIGLLCSAFVVALAPLITSLAARMFLMSGIYAAVGMLVAHVFIKRIRSTSIGAPAAQREAITTVKTMTQKVQHG